MKYSEARKYAQTIEKQGMVLGLESIRRLLAYIGNPQEKLKIVHVAGTNGKGSVMAFLSEILIHAGYRTGVYNSPAVFDELEIYRIDGDKMSKESYCHLMEIMKNAMEQIERDGYPSPTLFELETAMAFLYFASEKCDIVLIETGLGGLMDATNCIEKPLCSILTSISMDHMGILGNSLEEIAKQKAGIVKEGCPVVSSLQAEPVQKVIREVCAEKKAPLVMVDLSEAQVIRTEAMPPLRILGYKDFPQIQIALQGEHQVENAATALEAAAVLRNAGYVIEESHIREGMKAAVWPGRLTVLSKKPLVMMDGAHNENAAKQLVQVLKEDYPNRQWCFVMGVLADKEYEKIVEMMAPLAERVLTVTPDSPRALSAKRLAQTFCRFGCEDVTACDEAEFSSEAEAKKKAGFSDEEERKKKAEFSGNVNRTGVKKAVGEAVEWSQKKDDCGILAFGSFTFLKEFREQVEQMMFKVHHLLNHKLFVEKMEQLEQLEQNRQFCKHGWEHCLDVARGMALLNEERKMGLCKEMLYVTALIHDLGRVDEYLEGIPHEQAGVVLARQLLKEIGYDCSDIAIITEAIGEHRDVKSDGNMLTQLLKEADKKTRLCFRCKAKAQCKWSVDKMNDTIQL